MRPVFHPSLVNGPFGDPGLYVEFLFEKRALLFDLGDLHALPARKLLRVSHVFVSHTHMDHFVGFDRLLRICLGRGKRLTLFGPPGFIEQVQHKLAAYTWNLVQNYAAGFIIEANEIHPDGSALRVELHCQQAFRRDATQTLTLSGNVLLDEQAFRIRYAFLDHRTPCLAFALEEKQHVNVWKNRLDERGLATGPWLHELKRAVLRGDPDDTLIAVQWQTQAVGKPDHLPLGALKERVLHLVAGQKIAYVTDVIYHAGNAATITALGSGSELLFIEATFLDEDAAHAAQKYHLTARQAGMLARACRAKRVIPFHFSPKYAGQKARLRQELEAAYLTPPAQGLSSDFT